MCEPAWFVRKLRDERADMTLHSVHTHTHAHLADTPDRLCCWSVVDSSSSYILSMPLIWRFRFIINTPFMWRLRLNITYLKHAASCDDSGSCYILNTPLYQRSRARGTKGPADQRTRGPRRPRGPRGPRGPRPILPSCKYCNAHLLLFCMKLMWAGTRGPKDQGSRGPEDQGIKPTLPKPKNRANARSPKNLGPFWVDPTEKEC